MILRTALLCAPLSLCATCFLAGGQATSAHQAAPAKVAQTFAGPVDPGAQKSYEEAMTLKAHHDWAFALDGFKKANKLDGNRCGACVEQILSLAEARQDFKLADAAAQELIGMASTPQQQAQAHVARARLLQVMGKEKKKPEYFAEGEREAQLALTARPGDASAMLIQGLCLADQEKDEQARAVFARLLAELPPRSVDAGRVARYVARPELVRARMAPAFSVRTIDGKRVSLDELQNKVVLIDFWATWCGPCREALPHMKKIAKKFEGQPLIVLSISLDRDADEQKWKDFVAQNEMTWLQYRDGGFTGIVAQTFGVRAIPQTFTIDSDGVLQDQHIGDGNIEGKLKQLVAQAAERQAAAQKTELASAAPVSR